MNTSRREFLVTTAAAGLAAGCASPQPETPNEWIDAHVHVWTPDTTRYPLAEGFRKEAMNPPSYTPEELFAECQPHGVARIVLIQMSFYRYDNSYLLDCMRRYPGAFSGVAIIDENAPDVRGRMKALAERGVRGFRLYASAEKVAQWSASPGMQEMWTHGAESGLAMCCLADPEALPGIRAMCARHPETPVVIDHFGRVGMRGPVNEEQLGNLLRLAEFKRTHVKISAFYALGNKKPPYTDLGPLIARLLNAFGPERLMWATDCPFQSQKGHSYKASIELVRDKLAFLSLRDREWLLRRTAGKVFFS